MPRIVAVLFLFTICACSADKTPLKLIEQNDSFRVFQGQLDIPKHNNNSFNLAESLKIDLDGDQQEDFVLFGLQYPFSKTNHKVPIHFLKNIGAGQFELQTKAVFGDKTTIHVRSFKTRDIDNDGDQDFVISDHGLDLEPFIGGVSKVFLNNQGKSFTEIFQTERGFTFFNAIGDINGDSLDDIFFSRSYYSDNKKGAMVYLQNKQHQFIKDESMVKDILTTHRRHFLASVFIDFDHDGDQDLFLGGHDSKGDHTDIILINNKGKFNTIFNMPPRFKDKSWGTVEAIVKDLDGDGWEDIITTVHNPGFTQAAIQIYRNIKGQFFTSKQTDIISFPQQKNFWIPWLLVQDVTADKKPDLIFNLRGGSLKKPGIKNPLYLLKNQGNFIFKDISNLLPSNNRFFSSVHTIDYNQDGQLELLTFDYQFKYYIFEFKNKQR